MAISHPEVDVCIVGSGAGGAPVALECAKAGMKVVVLEKGPRYKPTEFVPHDELRHTMLDFFVPMDVDEPHLLRREGDPGPARSRFGWTARCVGGATVHMTGFFLRFRAEDMKMLSMFGSPEGANVADWPITYDELAPFYEEAEQYLGVSGIHSEIPASWRPAKPFPLPPVRHHPMKEAITNAARRLGYTPFTIPRAILSANHRGRNVCTYCHFCAAYGCEEGSKASALVTYLADAEASGSCEVRSLCMATRIDTSAEGRARQVVYMTPEGERTQPARVIVVACGAVESARLLLASASPAHPTGLANGSGLVGKNLMFSSGAEAEGFFPYAGGGVSEDLLRAEGMWIDVAVQDEYVNRTAGLPYPKAGTVSWVWRSPNPITYASELSRGPSGPIWGKELKDIMRRKMAGGRVLVAENFAGFLPTAGTSVTIDGSVTDKYGLPVARIELRHHPADTAAAKHLQMIGAKVLQAAGAKSVDLPGPGEAGYLQYGTCRFGDDPKHAVLDRNCRSHEVRNLFVTDGSFMPTAGGAPPTLTYYANATRVARFLVQEARAGRL